MGDCAGSNQGTDASDSMDAGQKMTAPKHKVILVCSLLGSTRSTAQPQHSAAQRSRRNSARGALDAPNPLYCVRSMLYCAASNCTTRLLLTMQPETRPFFCVSSHPSGLCPVAWEGDLRYQ
jgi:hypothetical protein